MPVKDLVAGLVTAAIGMVLYVGTYDFTEVSGHVSPRLFPQVIAGALLAFSLVLVVRAVRTLGAAGRSAAARPAATVVGYSALRRDFGAIALLVGACAVYVLSIDALGYVVATALFLAAAVYLYGERRWWLGGFVAVAGSVGLYATFRLVFDVPLPRFDLF